LDQRIAFSLGGAHVLYHHIAGHFGV
jgi:hypothetical protein